MHAMLNNGCRSSFFLDGGRRMMNIQWFPFSMYKYCYQCFSSNDEAISTILLLLFSFLWLWSGCNAVSTKRISQNGAIASTQCTYKLCFLVYKNFLVIGLANYSHKMASMYLIHPWTSFLTKRTMPWLVMIVCWGKETLIYTLVPVKTT